MLSTRTHHKHAIGLGLALLVWGVAVGSSSARAQFTPPPVPGPELGPATGPPPMPGPGASGPAERGAAASNVATGLPVPTDPLTRSAGPRVLVSDVRVVGNESTKEQLVQAQLKTRRAREFDPEVVQADVRRLAATGRFFDVKSYTQGTPEGVIVTFQVFERPTIQHIRFLGNRAISDKALEKQALLKQGDPLNRYAVEESRRKLEEFYQSKGYERAQVTILEGDKPQDKGAVFVINEGFLERISHVGFVGNTFVSGERLKTQVKSKPGILYLFGGKVDRKKIDEDIDRLTAYYRTFGYFNARIGRELQFNESGKWLTITFVVDEGERYQVRNVAVVGNQKFQTPELMSKLDLKPGDYFNLAKMNRDVGSLTDTYGGQGYIFADVKADPRFLEDPGQLDLVYKIQEGGVWHAERVNVKIAGEYPHTRESVVRNRVDIRPDEVLDIRKIRDSERRLKGSQLFENDPSKGEAPKVVVRNPETQESVGATAAGGTTPRRTYRGQSPERGQ